MLVNSILGQKMDLLQCSRLENMFCGVSPIALVHKNKLRASLRHLSQTDGLGIKRIVCQDLVRLQTSH